MLIQKHFANPDLTKHFLNKTYENEQPFRHCVTAMMIDGGGHLYLSAIDNYV